MKTVIESLLFEKQAKEVWSEEEKEDFIGWIARNHNAGDIVRGSSGARKVRWKRSGSGKSGGVRVVHYYLHEKDSIFLITLYPKSSQNSIKGHKIKELLK
jgi:hypothetical protein